MLQVINTSQAPAALGPYSQGIMVNNLIFTSGQIPIDPATGELIQGDFRLHIRQVLDNIKAILEASNSSFYKIIKLTVFLTDLENFSILNGVFAEYYENDPPARSVVEVNKLPKNAGIEIEAIAIIQ